MRSTRQRLGEKSISYMGIRRTLHLWWARRPLAACRAVLFASLVDDPSCDESLTAAEQDAERQRLFELMERLVQWKNSNDPRVLAEARAEIAAVVRRRSACGAGSVRGWGVNPLRGLSVWGWRPMPATSTRWRCSSTRLSSRSRPDMPGCPPRTPTRTVPQGWDPGRDPRAWQRMCATTAVDARAGQGAHRPPLSHGQPA